MEYMIGCNYWGSEYGTDMWKYWNEASVRNDLEVLSQYGVKYLRVFPNWRDFQPIHTQRGWCNQLRDYCFADDKPIDNEFGLDMQCVENFRTFANLAKGNGMKLVVSIVTGWMSGRLFAPPALEHCNHINDPQSLMWQVRLARGLVRNLKDIDNIAAWDLGNECNNLSAANTREEAYVWTATIRNAILSEDNTRQIMSGMHGLKVGNREPWLIQDQGELTDVMCPHPYPSPSVGGDIEPMNKLRTTLIPSAQCALYAGIANKPAIIQETGTFNLIVGNEDTTASFMSAVMLSGWANGSLGYFWWCAHDQKHLNNPPYSWSMNENELGLLREDLSPKKAAFTMQELSSVLNSMPFGELPQVETDAVCIIPDSPDNICHIANSAYVLAKQAGLNMNFVYFEQEIPDAKMYILPSLRGWSPIGQKALNAIMKKVENGATVLITDGTGFITEIDKTLGLESHGMGDDFERRTADFGDFKLPFYYDKKFLMTSAGAEALCEDEDGTVIFSRHKRGKGEVYFLNFALETQSWNIPNGYNKFPFYKVYQIAGKNILDEKPIVSNIPDIAVTIHPLNEEEAIAVAINYSNQSYPLDIELRNHAVSEVYYGSKDKVAACSAVIMKIEKL